jgi:hypothetical protein
METKETLQGILNDAIQLVEEDEDGIYSLLNYGWEDADTPSSEYAGLVMWDLDAPFTLDFAFWDRSTPPPSPTDRQEAFHKAGEDLVGTMDLARNAIALTRYCYEHRKPPEVLDEEELFWEHHAAACLWMSTSTDRLLDYFVMARFGLSVKRLKRLPEFKRLDDKTRLITRILELLPRENEGIQAKEASNGLIRLSAQLDTLRETRNEIVHEIASRRGRNAYLALKNQRKEAEQAHYAPRTFNHSKDGLATLSEASKFLAEAKHAELINALSQLKAWYKLLVKAASLIFEFEYWIRIGK